MTEFRGAKIALLLRDSVISIQRSSWPWLKDAGKWDLPGGARENGETAIECVCREVKEELGIDLDPTEIVFQKTYESVYHPGQLVYFMVGHISQSQLDAIKFGNEGQGWRLMGIEAFLNQPDTIEVHQSRLKDYLKTKKEAV